MSIRKAVAALQNVVIGYFSSVCPLTHSKVRLQPAAAAVNVTLVASAAAAQCCGVVLLGARRPPLSIDISCPPGAQQQTRRTPLLRSIDGIDRQTHRRTDIRPLHRPCSAYYADNVNNQQVELLVHNAGLSATGVGKTFSCACLSLSVCLPVLLTKTSRAIRTKCDRLDI